MSPHAVMPLWQGMTIIILVALTTQFTRWLPFIFFKSGRVPERIDYLGAILPDAMMALLVIYCLRHLPEKAHLYEALPELMAVAFTGLVHYVKGNMFLSIALGTILYMLLIRLPLIV